MSTQLNTNIKIAAPAPIDERYLSLRTSGGSPLPYSGTSEVYSTIVSSERYIGLTVNINGVEYWFKNDTSTLIIKESGGTITGGTNGLRTSGKSIVLGGVLTGDTIFSGGRLRYDSPKFYDNDAQIVDKKYVDMLAVGVHPKAAVQVASTGSDIDLTTGGLLTIDGILLTLGQRVLVKDQTNNTQNGIYSANTGTWGRTPDFDGLPSGETLQGSLIPVITGATHANSLWVLVEPKDYTGSTQSVLFTLFSSPSNTAGNSIVISGSTINVDITTGTLATALGNKLETSVYQSYTGVTAPILAAALTGATNGLHASGRNVGLGGTLTGNTTIETSTATLKLGSAGRNIVIEATGGANGSILIGECTMTSNYIYTDSTETVIDSGAGKMCMCSNNIAVNGTHFKYDSHPTVWTGATQIVDVAYVTGRTAGATTYNCASPSTTLVGGMGPGTSLTGRGLDDILQEILVPYLLPAFSGFGIVGLPPIIEIGCVIPISTSCQFTWGFTNSGNVQAATMCVRDTTAGATLATNISTSAPQSVNITPTAPLSFTTYGQSQSWCGSAKNTHATQFGSVNNTVHSYYPYYWGKCTCPFPSGVNRPVPDSAMVAGGTKVLAPSGGAISINFNTGADDYLWFAIPSTVVATKTAYYIPALGVGGTIGGGIGAGCNLFPAPVPAITVTTACWIKTYDVYISNKQSQGSNAMTIS